MDRKQDAQEMELKPEYLLRTYVFDGREVKLTGRIAKQKKRSGAQVTVWEICPLSVANSSPKNTSFNKWVKPLELFHIIGDNKLAQMHEANQTVAQPKLEEQK